MFDGEGGQPPTCCVGAPTAPLQGPSWFAFGEPGALGPCPDPTAEGLTGYQELKVEPHTCGACSCSPAACTLPEGTHTNAAKCPGDGSVAIPFGPDPAAGWEGVCSADGALPAGIQCNGAPCIQSISVPPVGVAPCEPTAAPAAPFPDPGWGRMARECKIEPPSNEACAAGQVCAPPPPTGDFTLCLYAEGEPPTCPPAYPARTVFYRSAEDDRGCEDCACWAPEGAECMAIVSAFSDSTCGAFAGGVVVTDQEGACFDVPTGTALGSAEASMVTGVPGSCTSSGGVPFGGVVPADPFTLCCQIPPEPPG